MNGVKEKDIEKSFICSFLWKNKEIMNKKEGVELLSILLSFESDRFQRFLIRKL